MAEGVPKLTKPVPGLFVQDIPRNRKIFKENDTSSMKDVALDLFRQKELSPQEKEEFRDWNVRLEKSKDAISLHVNKRVILFFMQAVVCYRTEMEFTIGKTIHQGLTASHIQIDGVEQKFNAAHSATLPSLYAKKQNKQQHVYLYRSGYYDESNSTIDLIKEVNDADRAIDEKFAISKLRDRSVKLINQVSRGSFTPDQAVVKFTSLLKKQIQSSLKKESCDKVKKVLELYLKHANALFENVQNPENIDQMLNLQMDSSLQAEVAKIVQTLQSDHRTSKEKIEHVIKAKVDEFPLLFRRKMHAEQNIARAPHHFYDLYYYRLLSACQGGDLPAVEKAIGVKFEPLKERVKALNHKNATLSKLDSSACEINFLAKEVLALASQSTNKTDLSKIKGLSEKKAICLRSSIYQLRYQMILDDQKAQSRIKSIIDDFCKKMQEKKKGPNRLESYFFEYMFSMAKTPSVEKMLGKLLNISRIQHSQKLRELRVNAKIHSGMESKNSRILGIANLLRQAIANPSRENKASLTKEIESIENAIQSEKRIAGKQRPYIKKLILKRVFDQAEEYERAQFEEYLQIKERKLNAEIENASKETAVDQFLKNKGKELDDACDKINEEIWKLHKKTNEFRSKLLVELRLSHGMSQEVLSQKYIALSDSHMSIKSVSHLENGRKIMTSKIIEKISEIFAVNHSLFYPSHFADEFFMEYNDGSKKIFYQL